MTRARLPWFFERAELHSGQVSWLLALEDAADIDAQLKKRIRNIGSAAHQPAGFDNLARGIGCGNSIVRRIRSPRRHHRPPIDRIVTAAADDARNGSRR
jgi:hypothetical protein